jgi:UDP-glucose 4-epimerase/dTDP-L-rhamnose 4-epimerase
VKYLVTGGAGMIGSNIVRQLLEKNYEVVVLDNLSAYPFNYLDEFGVGKLDAKFILGDIENENDIKKSLIGVDKVIHAAAYADVGASINNPRKDFDVNVIGTQNVLEESLKVGIQKFVFISSASVYGEGLFQDNIYPDEMESKGRWWHPGFKRTEMLHKESHPTYPLSTYGNSKLWGEQQTKLYNDLYDMPSCALRLFSVYGSPQVPKEGSHSWCVAIFSMLHLKNKTITVYHDGTQVRDFTHVRDIAKATILSSETNTTNGKIFNVGTEEPTQINEVVKQMENHLGKMDVKYKELPKGDPMGAAGYNKMMENILEWKPEYSLSEGIKEYCEWLTENKHLVPDWIQ